MRTAITFALLMLLPAIGASAQELVPVSALIESPESFDGDVLTIRGEIVGDFGVRSDTVWVQVNDDAYVDRPLLDRDRPAGGNTGIAVRYARDAHQAFGDPGGYGVRGPVVEVTGVFHHLDPESGGLTFVDAVEIDLVSASTPVETPPATGWHVAVGSVLAIVSLALMAQRRDVLGQLSRR